MPWPQALLDRAGRARVWVFDLDATLLDSFSGTSVRPGAAELLAHLGEHGRGVLVWSAGGDDYARRRLGRAGLLPLVKGVHGKGDRGTDGCYATDAVVAAHAPAGAPVSAVFVDDQPADLPARATVVAVRPYLGANPHDRELLCLYEQLLLPPF